MLQKKEIVVTKRPGRYALLDELRGLNLVSMILYHGLWDLMGFYGVTFGWFTGFPGHLWQRIGSGCFVLLSGFCVPLGRRTLRRGAFVFGAGALVSAVTLVFLPDAAVRFGVLTMLGSCMMLTALARPFLERIPAWFGAVIGLLCFICTENVSSGILGVGKWTVWIPLGFYRNPLTAFLGFPYSGFTSTDYFGLVPWLFLFWTGFFLYRMIGPERLEPLRRSLCPPLGWLGRHSLLVYLLHQPVLYLGLMLYFNLLRQ